MDLTVYHPWIKSKGGAERLLFEYAERSAHDITILTEYHTTSFEGYDVDVRARHDGDLPGGFMRKGLRVAADLLGRRLDLGDSDALLISEAGLGSLAALRNDGVPLGCYCHTPLRAAHQMEDDYAAEYHPLLRPVFRLAAAGYRVLERMAWSRFRFVAFNSDRTRTEARSAGLGPQARTEIVHPGVDTAAYTHRRAEDYFLYPSRFRPYKRQEMAIEAFERFSDDHDGYELVLAGFPDDEEYIDELRERAGDDVRFATDVSDEEMRELYAGCTAVLFPAQDEDWGIVPLEANAAGKPVIAADEGGPTESIRDGETGFLVDSMAEMAERMAEVAADPERWQAACEDNAARYSWDRFTEELDALVEEELDD